MNAGVGCHLSLEQAWVTPLREVPLLWISLQFMGQLCAHQHQPGPLCVCLNWCNTAQAPASGTTAQDLNRASVRHDPEARLQLLFVGLDHQFVIYSFPTAPMLFFSSTSLPWHTLTHLVNCNTSALVPRGTNVYHGLSLQGTRGLWDTSTQYQSEDETCVQCP